MANDPATIQEVTRLFPVLAHLPDAVKEVVFHHGRVVERPAGDMLMRQNNQCMFMPLVLTGSLRVYKVSSSGREISLYRTGPGETCLISVACHLRGEPFPANVEVEDDVRMFQIPTAVYLSELAPRPEWKDFIISTLYDRLLESLQVIEEVAFSRVDHRLAQWLLDQSRGKASSVYATHEGIATELGSAREVISRILGQFRDAGAVRLSRGRIRVEDPEFLKTMIH